MNVHTVFLSLSHTYALTYYVCVCLSLAHAQASITHGLSLFPTDTHKHALSFMNYLHEPHHPQTQTHTQTHAQIHAHTQTNTHTHTHTHTQGAVGL